LFEHDLFRKPVATFRDHALAQSRGASGAPTELRHCAMLSEMTFIDAMAVWLTVA
jgi:hypothetical protein